MILPIYVYGQPVLRKEAEDIDADYPNLKELIANMFETMERCRWSRVGSSADRFAYSRSNHYTRPVVG